MPDETLILHWDMFEIENGKIEDASEKDNDGVVQGNPQLVPDDVFGSCLSFNEPGKGAGDRVTAANIGLTSPNPAHTIEAWIYVKDYPPGRAWLLVLGQYGPGAHHWILASGGASQLGLWSGPQARPTIPRGAWTHIAMVYDGQQLSCYVNGVEQGQPQPAAFKFTNWNFAVAQAPAGEFGFSGKVASVRVYNRALTAAEVNLDMQDDQTAMAAFRQTHPVDFNLYDDDDQQVLYIDDDPTGRNLRLEIANTSRQAIELVKQATDTAAAGNCHFELRFRPGTLSAASLSQIALAESGWRLAKSQPNGDGVSLYLLRSESLTVNPADKIKLTLQHVGADAGDGARGTRVELKYGQLKYSNDVTPIVGFRARHLNVVNQRGKKNIPLHVGFAGPNLVLNDGRSSVDLLLRITNTRSKDSIDWNPAGANASKLIITFDVQKDGESKDWALGTASDVAGIQPECAGWTIKFNPQSITPEWVVTHATKKSLAPGEFILLKLRGVKSSLPSGHANLYLHYENIPGYWDGQFVCVAEKGPLIYNQNRVGIGTSSPRSPLSVRGAGVGEELLAFEDVGGATKWHISQKVGGVNSGLNFSESGVADGRLYIKAGGNVGVGTVNPQAKLQIVQGAIMPEKGATEDSGILFPKNPGGGSGDAAWIRYYARSGEATTFEIGTANDGDDHIALMASGGVGVGTVSPPPGIKLTVSASGNHMQLRREGAEKTGGKFLFLELYQQDDRAPAVVPEVYPSIRFHHGNRFWHRIEGRPDGIHFKEGNLAGDGHINIFAGNVIGFAGPASGNSIQKGFDFNVPANTAFKTNQQGRFSVGFSNADGLKITGRVGGVLATANRGVLVWGDWNGIGEVVVHGKIWAQEKNFLIPHPTRPGYNLAHSCIEGPEVGVYYRGEAQLRQGEATIRLPEYFEALTRKEGRTVLLTAKGKEPFRLSYEEIRDGQFKIYGTRADGAFSWEVKAIRADVDYLTVEAPKPKA